MERVELKKEDREHAVRHIQAFFAEERDEELGQLAATLLYDFIARELGPLFYNEGLHAAQVLRWRAADSIDSDLDAAKRLPPAGRRGPG